MLRCVCQDCVILSIVFFQVTHISPLLHLCVVLPHLPLRPSLVKGLYQKDNCFILCANSAITLCRNTKDGISAQLVYELRCRHLIKPGLYNFSPSFSHIIPFPLGPALLPGGRGTHIPLKSSTHWN